MSQKTSQKVPVLGTEVRRFRDMAINGCARDSTEQQSLDLNADALISAGAIKIFTDLGVSGSKVSHPGLDAALEFMREGDVLMVWRLTEQGVQR